MQKELGRYLLLVFRKKYKTVRHLKKYPPKVKNYNLNVTDVLFSEFKNAFSWNFQFHRRDPIYSPLIFIQSINSCITTLRGKSRLTHIDPFIL